MSQAALVSFDNARSLLNDEEASIWTNAILLPFIQQAYRELQAKLKNTVGPIMITEIANPVTAGTVILLPAANIIEPIQAWEKATADPDSAYTIMTEVKTIPNIPVTATLRCWKWNGFELTFLGATANREVKVKYFASLAPIVDETTSIPFINAENYLGPRTAGLAYSSVGENATSAAENTALADASLDDIIKSNHGITIKVRP